MMMMRLILWRRVWRCIEFHQKDSSFEEKSNQQEKEDETATNNRCQDNCKLTALQRITVVGIFSPSDSFTDRVVTWNTWCAWREFITRCLLEFMVFIFVCDLWVCFKRYKTCSQESSKTLFMYYTTNSTFSLMKTSQSAFYGSLKSILEWILHVSWSHSSLTFPFLLCFSFSSLPLLDFVSRYWLSNRSERGCKTENKDCTEGTVTGGKSCDFWCRRKKNCSNLRTHKRLEVDSRFHPLDSEWWFLILRLLVSKKRKRKREKQELRRDI